MSGAKYAFVIKVEDCTEFFGPDEIDETYARWRKLVSKGYRVVLRPWEPEDSEPLSQESEADLVMILREGLFPKAEPDPSVYGHSSRWCDQSAGVPRGTFGGPSTATEAKEKK